jgi:hypothetical protein
MSETRFPKAALRRLEVEAGQPVVPGELVPWCRAVDGAIASLGEELRAHRETRESTARRIVRRDVALAPRVERAREQADALTRELEALSRRCRRLLEEESEHATSSRESLNSVEALRRDLIAWVVATRAVEAELRTWLVESVYRDRGVAG